MLRPVARLQRCSGVAQKTGPGQRGIRIQTLRSRRGMWHQIGHRRSIAAHNKPLAPLFNRRDQPRKLGFRLIKIHRDHGANLRIDQTWSSLYTPTPLNSRLSIRSEHFFDFRRTAPLPHSDFKNASIRGTDTIKCHHLRTLLEPLGEANAEGEGCAETNHRAYRINRRPDDG